MDARISLSIAARSHHSPRPPVPIAGLSTSSTSFPEVTRAFAAPALSAKARKITIFRSLFDLYETNSDIRDDKVQETKDFQQIYAVYFMEISATNQAVSGDCV